VDEIGSFIIDCLHKRFEDAAESVGFESAEGGYGLPTFSVDEILLDDLVITSERVEDPRTLIEDLVHPDGTPYVRRDPYGPKSGGGDLLQSWECFSEAVRTNRRYTVFLIEKPRYESAEHIPSFLGGLAKLLAREYSTSLAKGKVIYRGRILGPHWRPSHETLTSPKKNFTVDNRMSPKGVSFFYGAMDVDTVISELRPPIASCAAVASFKLQRRINLINLGPNIRWCDIFDAGYEFFRDEHYAPFLNTFVELISRPLGSSDPQIDYLPTQVLTEYLRFKRGFEFDGILYRSAQRKGGVNVVLFQEDNISTESMDCDGALLRYTGYQLFNVDGVEYKSRTIADQAINRVGRMR
jgi:hypothetical protein